MNDLQIDGYELYEFYHGDEHYPLYVGGTGPAVVIVHEIPGITPQVIYFADRVREAGFTVYMPSLFGTPNKQFSPSYAGQMLARACIRKEFKVLAANESSPITEFLRAVCRTAHEECGGPGVGAIGMCLTGNFALSLMLDESVIAPVVSQPSLPLAAANKPAGIHMSDSEISCVKNRMKDDDGLSILGLRFSADTMVPKSRFDSLQKTFGDRFEAIEIDSSIGNPHGISSFAHSVLTNDLIDSEGHPTHQALERVLSFFNDRLAA